MTENQFEDLEGELRAMLRRRAAAVQPQRPEWDALMAAHRNGETSGTTRSRLPLRRAWSAPPAPWARPVAAAASVLALVLVGAMVINRDSSSPTLDGGGLPGESDRSEQVHTPAPGSENFDLAAAAPVFPVTDEASMTSLRVSQLDRLEDPLAVAGEYLDEVGIADGRGMIEDVNIDFPPDADGTDRTEKELEDRTEVLVSWSTWSYELRTAGHVFLRRNPVIDRDGVARRPWVVVGARTDGIGLRSVRREGETLSFEVHRDGDETGIERLAVDVNGAPVDVATPLPGESARARVRVPRDEPVMIRVQHVDRTPISIVAMTVRPLTEPEPGRPAVDVPARR